MLKYCKNCILCGDIDFFCLLCKESFETHDEVEKHIRWEQHRKLMKTLEYFPKFKNDGVYKLTDKYFCEFCNFLTPTFNAIKKHVKEESHKTKKADPKSDKKESLVKRDFDFVVVSKIVMNKKEWHGIVKNQCLFCNTSVDNFTTHRNLPAHMISLIQAEIIKEEDEEHNEQIYRKFNEDSFYCFKCKKSIFREFLSVHWTSNDHVGKMAERNTKVKRMFEIDRETCTATCVICNETLMWTRGLDPMDKHREAHIEKGEWTKDKNETEEEFMEMQFQDKGKLRSELKNYGKDNFIKLNEGGSKGYCKLCNTYISAHIRNFRQHVNGLRHIGFLELKGLVKPTRKAEKPHYKTKPFNSFYGELIRVKKSEIFLVPSAELCIDKMSINMIAALFNKRNQYRCDKYVCFVCDEVFGSLKEHQNGDHQQKLLKVNVITSLKEEFIREIRSGLYHCGVCNQVFAGWSILEKHRQLYKHRFARIEANTKIGNYADHMMSTMDGNIIDTSGFFGVESRAHLD
ncbi:hypothetical protein NE865_02306 [Phthorimaea operculella]|nr:hypothetical protein NE865_02306 [Phthorimaea operculella]